MEKITKRVPVWAILFGSLVLAIGCGTTETEIKPKDKVVIGPTAPSGPTTTTTQFGNQDMSQHELLQNTVNGEYAGIGKEFVDGNYIVGPSQMGQGLSAASRLWYVRIEFLTMDGAKVDPKSFNHPRYGLHNIRMTLESEAKPGQRYVAMGLVPILYSTGSILGGEELIGGSNFKILFKSKEGRRRNLPLITRPAGGGSVVRTFGVGSVTVEDRQTGMKHQIDF